jgi:hypothetical protein
VDEGKQMAELLGRMKDEGRTARLKTYVHKLLAAFGTEEIHPLSFNL